MGQQQRVAAARALIGRPALIVADEPTSALDSDRQKYFLEVLFSQLNLNQQTLVFVSHNESLTASFDRVVRISEINRHVAA